MVNRNQPSFLGSTAASPSASTGLTLATRRATSQPASRALIMHNTSAARTGNHPTCRWKSGGIAPARTNTSRITNASPMPGIAPARAPVNDTRVISALIIQWICRGVAPMARSRASSRRRCRTDSARVLATTNTTISTMVPPNDAAVSTTRLRASPTSRNSTSPRPAPVWATTPGTAAVMRPASSSAVTPGAASTPTASTRSGRPDSFLAWSSVKNTADCRSSPSPGAVAMPTTR